MILYDTRSNIVYTDTTATDYSAFVEKALQTLNDIVDIKFDNIINNIEIKNKVFVNCCFYAIDAVKFIDCEFQYTSFECVNRCLFEDSIIANSKFVFRVENCSVQECDVSDVVFEKGLQNCDSEKSTFKTCNFHSLQNVCFDRCDFEDCEAFEELLSNVSFDRSLFATRQSFLKVGLFNCDFRETKGELCFIDCELHDINFMSASLEYSSFIRCECEKVLFDNALVRTTIFDTCRMEETSFDNANLEDTTYEMCYLSACTFTKAKNIVDFVTFQPSVIIKDDCVFDTFPSNVHKVSLKFSPNPVNKTPTVQQSASGIKSFLNKYPNICPSCGSPAYQGLTGWLCSNKYCVFADNT